MIGMIGLLALMASGVFLFMRHPMFGKLPEGERLERIKRSPNYKNGTFRNISGADITISTGMKIRGVWKLFLDKTKDVRPDKDIPTVKTDLKNLPLDKDILVWFGHSSLYLQIDGKRILFDPVLISGSPVSFFNKPFRGTSFYQPEDMPDVDYLVITHDHWDHLDYQTMLQLKDRTGKVICPLGVGGHFEYWGFNPENIIELDWYEDTRLTNEMKFTALPSSHFSGRGLDSDRSLWAGYMLQSPSGNIYLSGDGGYDTHFKQIKERFGTIDLAIMENGQYNEMIRHIHIIPEDLVKAIEDLQPKRLMTVHNSKFALGVHPWYEPMQKIEEASRKYSFKLITPMIGEPVMLKDSTQTFTKWWEER